MEFKLSVSLKASAEKVYKTWLNSKGHTDMTGGKASISDKPGSAFSAWNEYIHGEILDLEKNKQILQTWRTTDFKSNQEDSLVEIELIPVDSKSCKLVLHHSNLDEKDDQYIQGWKEHYFEPMKKYFSRK